MNTHTNNVADDIHNYGRGYTGTPAVAYETGTGVQAVAVGDGIGQAIKAMLTVASEEETNIVDYVWMDTDKYAAYLSLVKRYAGDIVSCSHCGQNVTLSVVDWIEAVGKCESCTEETTFYDF